MAINKESTGFTFLFTFLMVAVVGTTLSVAAMALKEPQQKNVSQEKMQNILASIGVEVDRAAAPAEFSKYVTERIILDHTGQVVSNNNGEIDKLDKETEAFNVDVKKQYRSIKANAMTAEDGKYPLYVCKKDNETYYVIPMAGNGLWGPIWGFLAMESDLNTVYGAKFDHKTETPGLGAEINTGMFQDPFKGKKIFDEAGNFVSITVVKGGAKEGDMHGVDAITGGTITSNGVTYMLENTLATYETYFKSNKS